MGKLVFVDIAVAGFDAAGDKMAGVGIVAVAVGGIVGVGRMV